MVCFWICVVCVKYQIFLFKYEVYILIGESCVVFFAFAYLVVNCVFLGVEFWKVAIWALGGCGNIGKWIGAECLKWGMIEFYSVVSFHPDGVLR